MDTPNKKKNSDQEPLFPKWFEYMGLIFLLFIIASGLAIIFSFLILLNSDSSFVMMGGDCVESTSYDVMYLDGQITGKFEQSISIEIIKPEGDCPQSTDESRLVTINPDRTFSEQISHYLGDDGVMLVITGTNDFHCELGFYPQARLELTLEIEANEQITVSGSGVRYTYTYPTVNGQTDYSQIELTETERIDKTYCTQTD